MIFDKLIEKKVTAFQNELTRKYYDEVENMYAKMRGWRHDYRHHIQTMKVHMANGEYEETEKYLDMLDDDLTNVETVIKTGNKMADAILNSKLSLAVQKNINVKAEAKIPVSLTVSELDLCIVISNLLDNAIDACMELPEEKAAYPRIYGDEGQLPLYVRVEHRVRRKEEKLQDKQGRGTRHRAYPR